MVILTQDFDGFGNHLLLTSHFLANVVEHNYELAIPSFSRYVPYFEGTANQDFEGLPVRLQPGGAVFDALYRTVRIRGGWGWKCLRRLPSLQRLLGVRLLLDHGSDEVDLNDPAYLDAARSENLLMHTWQYRDKIHFAQHGDFLRRVFRPIAVHRQVVEQVLRTNRAGTDVLVGIHIRRGDYAGWYGGAFLYENPTYARAMRQMQALFPASTRVRFLLFSNEPIADTDFADFDTGRSSDHPVEDLYAMAGCDYIIGPISTYSMWASFYGRVPLFHLHRPDQPISSLDDFMVFEDQANIKRWEPSFS
ncbi:alpha-1,2-fucosyltransferase [Hymenobacter artigasi]|uniref:Alpha-1,2-fucosyltransferase n=1 Tax=Hymenobacter artigasi TaxID=2719616 RepID=A0ABX1HHK2_9BACT|nr:alpha-1,2-fucosyltransferase [Hymenobacter artigasi]NKI88622.1 hypothetical protein [Hymenobacter artigasi]